MACSCNFKTILLKKEEVLSHWERNISMQRYNFELFYNIELNAYFFSVQKDLQLGSVPSPISILYQYILSILKQHNITIHYINSCHKEMKYENPSFQCFGNQSIDIPGRWFHFYVCGVFVIEEMHCLPNKARNSWANNVFQTLLTKTDYAQSGLAP